MKTLLILLAVLGTGLVALVGAWGYVVQNVETPDHETLRQDGEFELRAYPPLTLAEVTRGGPRRAALSDGFAPLAGYIFARERPGEKIAMTAPVLQEPAGDRWTVAFVMPAGRRVEDLPAPAREEVRLRTVPARRMAAIRFPGHPTDADLAAQEARLRDWMAAAGLEAAGAPLHAYYNDPFTPGFLRRNEVLIPVAAPSDEAAPAGSAGAAPAG